MIKRRLVTNLSRQNLSMFQSKNDQCRQDLVGQHLSLSTRANIHTNMITKTFLPEYIWQDSKAFPDTNVSKQSMELNNLWIWVMHQILHNNAGIGEKTAFLLSTKLAARNGKCMWPYITDHSRVRNPNKRVEYFKP